MWNLCTVSRGVGPMIFIILRCEMAVKCWHYFDYFEVYDRSLAASKINYVNIYRCCLVLAVKTVLTYGSPMGFSGEETWFTIDLPLPAFVS